MHFNIADMIMKDVLIERSLRNPALAPSRKPTLENFAKVVAGDIEVVAIAKMAESLYNMFKQTYEEYSLINGIYEDIPTEDYREEWESGLDDAVEAAVEPFVDKLSQSWLGEKMIDTRIWTPEEQSSLGRSMAKEILKQSYYGKETAQIITDAGFANAELQVYLDQHLAGATNQTTGEADMAEDNSLESVAMRIKAHVGMDFDEFTVYGDIELMMDDDDILAKGAAQRLGAEEADIELVRILPMTYGDDAMQTFLDMIKAASSADVKPKRQSRKSAATPAPAGAVPSPTAPVPPSVPKAPVAGAVDVSVLQALKEHAATKDTEFSASLGVSRGTYNNWVNGKVAFSPDDTQYDVLRNELLMRANGLLAALGTLDGVDPVVVH